MSTLYLVEKCWHHHLKGVTTRSHLKKGPKKCPKGVVLVFIVKSVSTQMYHFQLRASGIQQ